MHASTNMLQRRLQIDLPGRHPTQYPVPWRCVEGQLGIEWNASTSTRQRFRDINLVGRWGKWVWDAFGQFSLCLVWEGQRNTEDKSGSWCCFSLHPPF